MVKNTGLEGSKVSFRRLGSDLYFSIQGDNREYLIDFGTEDRANAIRPDLTELIWAIERAWREEITDR